MKNIQILSLTFFVTFRAALKAPEWEGDSLDLSLPYHRGWGNKLTQVRDTDLGYSLSRGEKGRNPIWTGKGALVLSPLLLFYGGRCSHSGKKIPSFKEVEATLLLHFSEAGEVRGSETKVGSVGERANAEQPFSPPSASCLQASLLAPRQSFPSDHTWLPSAPHLSLTWPGSSFETLLFTLSHHSNTCPEISEMSTNFPGAGLDQVRRCDSGPERAYHSLILRVFHILFRLLTLSPCLSGPCILSIVVPNSGYLWVM